MEVDGDGGDSDSSYFSSSFLDDCPLFELNPRKGSLYLEEDEDPLNLPLDKMQTPTVSRNKMKE